MGAAGSCLGQGDSSKNEMTCLAQSQCKALLARQVSHSSGTRQLQAEAQQDPQLIKDLTRKLG